MAAIDLHKILTLFSINGVNKWSMQQIADHVNVDYDTFISIFPSEIHLIGQVLEYYIQSIIAPQIDNQKTDNDAIVIYFTGIKHYVNAERVNKNIFFSDVQAKYPDFFQTVRLKVYEKATIIVVYNVNLGIEQGYFHQDLDVDYFVRTYIFLLFSVSFSPFFDDTSQEREVDILVTELFLYKICTDKGLKRLEQVRKMYKHLE